MVFTLSSGPQFVGLKALSRILRKLSLGFPFFSNFLKCSVGDGSNTYFWETFGVCLARNMLKEVLFYPLFRDKGCFISHPRSPFYFFIFLFMEPLA